MWSIGGDPTRSAISTFFVQPFFNYNLKGGWSLFFGSSGITANWTATPQQGKWLPANTPYGNIRFNWALLFPIKRGGPQI